MGRLVLAGVGAASDRARRRAHRAERGEAWGPLGHERAETSVVGFVGEVGELLVGHAELGTSMLQTVGASHPRWNPLRKKLAVLFTVLVCGGFAAVPLAVLAGVLK